MNYPTMRENDDSWEGIYKITDGHRIGYIEIHEWEDWFEDEELDEENGIPDGAWYYDYNFGDGTDGGVLGYRYGDSLHELDEWDNSFEILEKVAEPGTELYEAIMFWIEEMTEGVSFEESV